MNDNDWKKMGRSQIVSGLHYLQKLNPTAESTGKGVLLVFEGARFMFGFDMAGYLKDKFNLTGSYSDILSGLGDLHTNKEWQKIVWEFLQEHDADFTKTEQKIADQKKSERNEMKHSELRQAFLIRYPHLGNTKQQIQTPLIKGGKMFAKNASLANSPLNEIDVKTSDSQMDVFLATIEVRQPKSVKMKRKYRKYTAVVNLRTNEFQFTDNHTVYDNYCSVKHVKNDGQHKPFKLGGKFKELVNLEPYFAQYLYLCHRKYQKLGMA